MREKSVSILAAVFLAVIAAFLAGMWSTYKGWWPWQRMAEVQEMWRSYRATGRLLPALTYAHRKPDTPDSFDSIHFPDEIARGVWLIVRLDPDTAMYVADLVDGEGRLLGSRVIDYSRIDPAGSPTEFVRVAALLPDGSILVVWDDAHGLARLDACGRPLWARTDQVYHHVIEKGVDGYWTWQAGVSNEGEDQRMVRFDPETGEILESIDLIDDVILKSPANRLAMRMPEGYRYDRTAAKGQRPDLFHPNDVEELLPEMAAAFPQFAAGDLLISLRNTDTVAVIGRHDGRVKWIGYGPWLHQHDPDFQPDGTITVFSNNTDRFRSALMRIDPATGATEEMFDGQGVDFDSFIMGNHQRLPNGNWMIVSTMQGRVLEVAPDGRVLREFNNVINRDYNAIVVHAEFHPEGYLRSVPRCAG